MKEISGTSHLMQDLLQTLQNSFTSKVNIERIHDKCNDTERSLISYFVDIH